MAKPLTVGQLIWRLMRQPWDAKVFIYTGDQALDAYDVSIDDGVVSIGCEVPEPLTLPGEKQAPRQQYRAQGAIFNVCFPDQSERPKIGQSIQINLGHGRVVRGTVLGFDMYGNCTIQADPPEPIRVNLTAAQFYQMYRMRNQK